MLRNYIGKDTQVGKPTENSHLVLPVLKRDAEINAFFVREFQ